MEAKKSLYILLILFSILSLNAYTAASSHLIRLSEDEAALIKLDGKNYCFIRFEGVNITGETLWLYVADKADMDKLINATRLKVGEHHLITLEETEVKVILKSIVNKNTALFELKTDLKGETVDVLIDRIPSEAGITNASFLPASILMGAASVAAAWCLVQGMTIGASTMAESGTASIWGKLLSISGVIIFFFGFFIAGSALLASDILPVFTFVAAFLLLGFVLLLFIVGGGGSSKSVKRSKRE